MPSMTRTLFRSLKIFKTNIEYAEAIDIAETTGPKAKSFLQLPSDIRNNIYENWIPWAIAVCSKRARPHSKRGHHYPSASKSDAQAP